MSPQEKELWQRRYEQLRQQVVKPDAALAQDRWGLGLLLRKGLAGWMRLWQDPAATAQQATPAERIASTGPAPGWQQSVTLLLTNMALSRFHPSTSQLI